jgi:hypothetical protein
MAEAAGFFFPTYDETTFKRHLQVMEPEVFDAASGKMFITYQTFVVLTPRHTILVDTCTGEDKGHPPPFDFPGKERCRNELFALGVRYDKIDYVFCTSRQRYHAEGSYHPSRIPARCYYRSISQRRPQGW